MLGEQETSKALNKALSKAQACQKLCPLGLIAWVIQIFFSQKKGSPGYNLDSSGF
jgi:hypothetical protein